MKKTLFIFAAASCIALCMKAQSTTEVKEEVEYWETTRTEINVDERIVETELFLTNWFFSLNGGAQTYAGSKQEFGFSNLTPIFSVSAGKWFTPTIGVRLMGNGLVAGVTEDRPRYINLQGDAMFNVFNQFIGYNENRFYSLIPYAGVGWNWMLADKRAGELCAAAGIQNTFRLNKYFDLNLDLRATFSRDCFAGNGEEQACIASATAGIIFNIPYKDMAKGWNQPTITYVINRTGENRLQEAIARLIENNDELRKAIADCQDTETIVKIIGEAAPILVTFDIDKIDLKKADRVNLGFFSEIIKAGDPNIVYSIVGFADKGTGSEKRNWWLSENRARVVYECLVNEFGINPKQLTTDYKGGVDNMYYDDPKLSRSVIVKAIK